MTQLSIVKYFIFVYQPFSIIISYLFSLYLYCSSIVFKVCCFSVSCSTRDIGRISYLHVNVSLLKTGSIFCEDAIYKCNVNNRNSGCEWVS